MAESRTDPSLAIPLEAKPLKEDDDYQVIHLSISWGASSILAFVAVLSLQVFARQLGISLAQVIGGTVVLTLAGLATGMLGLKFGNSPGAARVGLFLNGVVMAIFVLVPMITIILKNLR